MEQYPNKFGNLFKITSFGESHSKAIGVLIEGLKPNIEIDLNDIQNLLNQRKPGNKEFTTKRNETDELEVLSGIFEGKTLGTPIVVIVKNTDAKSIDYENIKDKFRPSHADYVFFKKYGIRDYRGGGRASGRETISRIIPGAFAINYLKKLNIEIESKIVQIGNIIKKSDDILKDAENLLNNLNGNSVGAVIETKIFNVKPGLGDPVFEKLSANLAKAIFSIPAIKGIEFGDGFLLSSSFGSQVNDEMNSKGFLSNHSGGIDGGISNGNTIVIKTAIKPTPSIKLKQKTVDVNNNNVEIEIKGRHDPIIAIRIIPVINSMVAITLFDAFMSQLYCENDTVMTNLRQKIDDIDIDLFQTLNERFNIVKNVGMLKKQQNLNTEDKNREENLLNMIKSLELENISEDFIKRFYEFIFNYSKDLQSRLKQVE